MNKWYPSHIKTDKEREGYDAETDAIYVTLREEDAKRLAKLYAEHENDPLINGLPVDLSRGHEGICERFGKRWYTHVTRLQTGVYEIRIESGWYDKYDRWGTCITGNGHITFFAPCNWASPQARHLASKTTP